MQLTEFADLVQMLYNHGKDSELYGLREGTIQQLIQSAAHVRQNQGNIQQEQRKGNRKVQPSGSFDVPMLR